MHVCGSANRVQHFVPACLGFESQGAHSYHCSDITRASMGGENILLARVYSAVCAMKIDWSLQLTCMH